MQSKHPVCQQRVRKVPRQFSWVDQRLVRERYIDACSHADAALYLFLITVCDHQGLSYYSDPVLMQRLAMPAHALEQARNNLIRLSLIAWRKPLYQVLALDKEHSFERDSQVRSGQGGPMPIAEIFKRIAEKCS